MSEQVVQVRPVTYPVPSVSATIPAAADPTAVLPAGDGGATQQTVFGITFNLNNQMITINTADLADLAKNGVDLQLPGPTTIGTIADFVTWFNTTFGVTLPDPSTFPSPLDQIFAKLESLVWTVNAAHVHVYPKGDTTPTAYTLSVTAEWIGAGVPLIPNVLSIQGATFGITNESQTPAGQ